MQYLGGKHKLAQRLRLVMKVPYSATYVEPFVGSGSVMAIHDGVSKRIAGDLCPEIIALHKAVQSGWVPPTTVTREFYNEVKANRSDYSLELQGFLAFGCSFGGNFWCAYAKNKRGSDFAETTWNGLQKLHHKMKGVSFIHCSYENLPIPKNSFIYCDPPYSIATVYRGAGVFDTTKFTEWLIHMDECGHTIFVSEYDFSLPTSWQLIDTSEKMITIAKADNTQVATERIYSNKPKRGILDVYNLR